MKSITAEIAWFASPGAAGSFDKVAPDLAPRLANSCKTPENVSPLLLQCGQLFSPRSGYIWWCSLARMGREPWD